jgi:hypothetical protein
MPNRDRIALITAGSTRFPRCQFESGYAVMTFWELT